MRIMKPGRSSPTLPTRQLDGTGKQAVTEAVSALSPSSSSPQPIMQDQEGSAHGVRPLLHQLFFGSRARSHSDPKDKTSRASRGRRCNSDSAISHNNNDTNNKPCRVRVGSEDEVLKKNRRQVDHFLRRMGALMGKQVSLNAQSGMAYFAYKKFVVVVEVPTDNNSVLFIYTCVCRLDVDSSDRQDAAVLKRAMELNYMEHLTRGATLGLDDKEVNMCYSTPIQGLTFADMKAAMEAFLVTCGQVNEQLDAAKRVGMSSMNGGGTSMRSGQSYG